MEKKLLELKATLGDGMPGTIEGLGAATGNIDRGQDVIEPGAYANLSDFVRDGHLLVGHEWGEMGVATIDEAREVPEGLMFKGTWHTDDEAQKHRLRVKERLDRQKSVGLSIGYQTLEWKDAEQDGRYLRHLLKIEVYEISIVPVPMNPMAGVTGAKSFEDHYESALAAVKSVLTRAKSIHELRQSEGRKLSELNRTRIEALAAEMDGLHSQLKGLLSAPPSEVGEEEIAQIQKAMAANMIALARL